MENLTLTPEQLAMVTKKDKDYWETYLGKIEYAPIFSFVENGNLVVALPDGDSPAVKEAKRIGTNLKNMEG